jgi:hypothetical protein
VPVIPFNVADTDVLNSGRAPFVWGFGDRTAVTIPPDVTDRQEVFVDQVHCVVTLSVAPSL